MISLEKDLPLIVFSDLDGTLLDHETYSWAAAEPALAALRAQGIPLVLASSKTALEIAPLRAAMGFSHCPAIVENGAGLLAAGADPQALDDGDYLEIRAALTRLDPDLRAQFQGFGDLDAAGVARLTGLSLEDAASAKARQFSEPGTFSGDAEARAAFVSALTKFGLCATQGGRFLTLSKGATKADQIASLTAQLAPHARTMALGDAPNDLAMLMACDIGVIIPNPAHSGLTETAAPHLLRAPKAGPEGWAISVRAQLAQRSN